MDLVELSRRLSPRALRRLARRYRKQLVAGASLAAAAAFSIMLSIPVFAHDGETKTPPAACDFTTLPLTTACAALVTPPAVAVPPTTAGDYVVTLPGSGTLTLTIDASGKVTGAAVVITGYTFSVPTIDKDGDKVSVTLTSVADPTQVIKVTASVRPPATANGPATVKATVKPAEKEDADDANEANEANKPADNESANNTLSDHKGGGGREHGGGGGDH
jgi:hypothetical protein